MDHVNNAVYADWLDEEVIRAGGTDAVRAIPRTVRLEYVRAVEADATIATEAWADGGRWSFRVVGPSGEDLLRATLEATAPTPA